VNSITSINITILSEWSGGRNRTQLCGDMIVFDIENRRLDVKLSAEEIKVRLAE
jgi:hypothetical protein